MKLSSIGFTSNGADLSIKLKELLKESGYECTLYSASSFVDQKEIEKTNKSLEEWSRDRFSEKNAIVFIGAMGIAVRAIAPCIKDKLSDVPVVVIDEKGRFVIPVLSGHVGGANELANLIASLLNAEAVITTATDINSKFAVDIFAKKNNLFITNIDGIAKVSSKVLEGINIRIAVDNKDREIYGEECHISGVDFVEYKEDDYFDVLITSDLNKKNADLILRPKEYVLGIGCKRGKNFEEIDEFVKDVLSENGIEINEVCAVSSIDVKKDEEGIKRFCEEYNIPFLTYTADELKEVKGDFETSDFVLENVGVDNVCERAAVKGGEEILGQIDKKRNEREGKAGLNTGRKDNVENAGEKKSIDDKPELTVKKQSRDGKTLAVVKIK